MTRCTSRIVSTSPMQTQTNAVVTTQILYCARCHHTLYHFIYRRCFINFTTSSICVTRYIYRNMVYTYEPPDATKPNPFEIISLQTTRKENNWKTEETLARVVVTLETERIKGSNPWYLWWWHISPKFMHTIRNRHQRVYIYIYVNRWVLSSCR